MPEIDFDELYQIPIGDFTEATVDGNGVFDVLMRATKSHLEQEYTKGRIKGNEYATVYLGALEHVMQTALGFFIEGGKARLEAEIARVRLEIAKVELEIAKLNALKVPAEIALLEAQAGLVTQQTANAVIEGTVLHAQKCKLDAEFDVLMRQVLKVDQETGLLQQKTLTERAQIAAVGVEENSVIGRQKSLYKAQTDGFQRDAEQKAAKLMVDSWNVRRTTDEGTSANTTNKLDDQSIGRAVNKLLAGVQA